MDSHEKLTAALYEGLVYLMFRCPECERGYNGSARVVGNDLTSAWQQALQHAIASHDHATRSCRFRPEAEAVHAAPPLYAQPFPGPLK